MPLTTTLPALTLSLAAAARPVREAPPWLVPAFLLCFVGLWVAIATFVGFIAGHMKLLARFPPVPERVAEQFRFASGAMRRVRFNNGLHVAIGSRGLHLGPSALFRPPFHRQLPCIPWHEVRLVQADTRNRLGFHTGSRFEIPSLQFPFTLVGEAGRSVARRLSGGVEPQPTMHRLVRER